MINFLYSIENFLNHRILGVPLRWIPPIPSWLRTLAIIVGMLGLSLVLGVGLSLPGYQRRLILLIGLLPAGIAVVVFSQWPISGLVALIITALIVRSPDLPGGLNFAVLLLALLLGLWVLDMIIRREFRLVRSRTVWPLFALVVVAALAFGQGQLPWFVFAHRAPLATQIGALMIFVFAAGAFLLVAHQVQDLRWLQWLTWLFVALGGLFVAGWVVPGLGSITGRLFQLGATSNSLFWTWLVALAFGQAYLNHKLHWSWRLAAGGIAALTIYVGFFLNRDWKSGYLPPLAALAVIIGLRSWKVAVLMILVAPIAAFYLTSDAVATDEYSYSTRIDAWLIIFEMVKRNPLLGFGPANYYWYTPLFPIRGWAVVFNSHNQLVDLVAQTGLLGLGCFFWFFGELGWLGWRLRHRAPEGFAQAYVYGALGGVAGTLVAATLADWVLPFVYNIGFNGFRGAILAWMFMGGLVSLEQMVRRQATVPSP
jgi:hypothetical protein